jgi:hypothetical protein
MSTPCPFCGITYENPEYTFSVNGGMKYGCRICPNCGACGPDVRTNSKIEDRQLWMDEADRLWDERPLANKEVYQTECSEGKNQCGGSHGMPTTNPPTELRPKEPPPIGE